jgi:hypothetical protein
VGEVAEEVRLVANTCNPPGMQRISLGGHPPWGYAILDGGQVVGHTFRIAVDDSRYWVAVPVDGRTPCTFPRYRHQEEAMLWLRNVS